MDTKNTALLIIDVQKGAFLEAEPIYKGDELLKNITISYFKGTN